MRKVWRGKISGYKSRELLVLPGSAFVVTSLLFLKDLDGASSCKVDLPSRRCALSSKKLRLYDVSPPFFCIEGLFERLFLHARCTEYHSLPDRDILCAQLSIAFKCLTRFLFG